MSEDFRGTVRAFLDQNLPADWRGFGALSEAERDAFRPAWRRTLHDAGYLAYEFPKEVGGSGYDVRECAIIQEEFLRKGAPLVVHPNDNFFMKMCGPTLLHWGTQEQKDFFFPKAYSGEHVWCQGYSEPGAGSDLFALRTRAERDSNGDWVINGQKIWTTLAFNANWIFALVRTDPDAPKAKGISFLLVPLDQPGVEVRPIRTMSGKAEFCEVFFTDARTDASMLVGPENGGAQVALTLLGFERGSGAASTAMQHTIELERIAQLIHQRGLAEDPIVRQRFGWCVERVEALQAMARQIVDTAADGAELGPESSFIKLYATEYDKLALEFVLDVLGPDALEHLGADSIVPFGVEPKGSPLDSGVWLDNYYLSRAATIYGGTSQVQRTTIAERIMGLPR